MFVTASATLQDQVPWAPVLPGMARACCSAATAARRRGLQGASRLARPCCTRLPPLRPLSSRQVAKSFTKLRNAVVPELAEVCGEGRAEGRGAVHNALGRRAGSAARLAAASFVDQPPLPAALPCPPLPCPARCTPTPLPVTTPRWPACRPRPSPSSSPPASSCACWTVGGAGGRQGAPCRSAAAQRRCRSVGAGCARPVLPGAASTPPFGRTPAGICTPPLAPASPAARTGAGTTREPFFPRRADGSILWAGGGDEDFDPGGRRGAGWVRSDGVGAWPNASAALVVAGCLLPTNACRLQPLARLACRSTYPCPLALHQMAWACWWSWTAAPTWSWRRSWRRRRRRRRAAQPRVRAAAAAEAGAGAGRGRGAALRQVSVVCTQPRHQQLPPSLLKHLHGPLPADEDDEEGGAAAAGGAGGAAPSRYVRHEVTFPVFQVRCWLCFYN